MTTRFLVEIPQPFAVPLLQTPRLPHEVRGLDVVVALGEQIYGQSMLESHPMREEETA